MSLYFIGWPEPTEAELWAIEAGVDVLAAELALVDAECRWYSNPTPDAAADLLQALAAVADLYDLLSHSPNELAA